jgi:hypothetical protein
MPIAFTSIERVTHDEDRKREALYWAQRSIAERVIAGWELRDNNPITREEHEPKERTGITLRRVVRGGR